MSGVWGVQGVVSTFGKGSHLWLPIAVACNGSHTLGTGFGELAKPGEGNRRVSNPQWVWIGQCQPYCMRSLTPGGTSGRVHLKSQRLWRRWQQMSLERLEQDVAPKEVLVIYCSLAVFHRNGSSCHWIKTSQAERVGLPLCTGFLTIKLSRTGQFCNSSPITNLSTYTFKSCGNGHAAKATGVGEH